MTVAALPALTLREVRVTAVEVPLRYVLGTSAAALRHAPLLLVDVQTEEGIAGCSYVFCYRRSGARAIAAVLPEAFELVVGQPVAPLEIAALFDRRFALIGVTGVVRMALSALDMALWDALAIAAGVPLATLLGSAPRPLRAYNSCGLGLMSPGAAADEAERLLEGGFQAMKLRLGHASLFEDLAATRGVRKRLPDSVLLMADYNQALSVAQALERGRALQSEGVTWLEEPIRHDDYAGNATLTRELATPIQIGENFDGPYAMADAIAARACDYAMPDFARIGGVSGWLEAAALAQAAGIELSSHLYPEFSAHLLAATPTCHWLEYVDWASPILQRPIEIRDGQAVIPSRPGAGIQWNEDAVNRYRATLK